MKKLIVLFLMFSFFSINAVSSEVPKSLILEFTGKIEKKRNGEIVKEVSHFRQMFDGDTLIVHKNASCTIYNSFGKKKVIMDL